MGRFQVFETPLALDRYKQASTDLLAMLDRSSTRRSMRTRPMSLASTRSDSARAGSRSRSRLRAAACTTWCIQVIEELGRVLVLDLVIFREP